MSKKVKFVLILVASIFIYCLTIFQTHQLYKLEVSVTGYPELTEYAIRPLEEYLDPAHTVNNTVSIGVMSTSYDITYLSNDVTILDTIKRRADSIGQLNELQPLKIVECEQDTLECQTASYMNKNIVIYNRLISNPSILKPRVIGPVYNNKPTYKYIFAFVLYVISLSIAFL